MACGQRHDAFACSDSPIFLHPTVALHPTVVLNPSTAPWFAAASAGEANVMLPVSILVDKACGGGPRPSGAPGMRGAQGIGIASAGGDVASLTSSRVAVDGLGICATELAKLGFGVAEHFGVGFMYEFTELSFGVATDRATNVHACNTVYIYMQTHCIHAQTVAAKE